VHDRASYARLRELFHAAVELPPDEQARFLDGLESEERRELAELLTANGSSRN
jgi:hypothetical protein